MKSIRMDFVRDGGVAGILDPEKKYHVIIESSRHRQFKVPLEHADFLSYLTELRYNPAISDEQRRTALKRLSEVVTGILEPPESTAGMLQLDLVIDAKELWALPFEAAHALDGNPLFTRRQPAIVLTRRVPQEFAERQLSWPARPRVLFAYATPEWAHGASVEARKHKEALLKALQPWVDPLPGLLVGDEKSVLTTIEEASLLAISEACRKAEEEGRPYTHVHLLAHGAEMEDPLYRHKTRYGIALQSDDKKPTTPEDLARIFCPRPSNREGGPTPLVVTLAICDGANVENTIIEAGGVAQELQRAGVPIVVASQLPLTFPGSVIMTSEFYQAWMAGKDVREALHETRVALFEAEGVGHDWASLVAYVRLPEGYSDYLLDVSLVSQLAALETTSNYASRLLETGGPEAAYYDQVTERMQECIKRLEEFLNRNDIKTKRTKVEVEQENAGLLGSAYKRLAELLAGRVRKDSDRREFWLAESRSALEKARDAYRNGFRRNSSNHWTGVQYLVLDAILNGQVSSLATWFACYVAAEAELEDPEKFAAEAELENIYKIKMKKIWALGSIAELCLLAPLAQGATLTLKDASDAITDLCERVRQLPAEKSTLFPILSTRRQLMRYVDWWTKANGFFEGRDTDLSADALTLADMLREK